MNDHSASRNVDVLAEEAPHLIAPDTLTVREQQLHDHYASNAIANGHHPGCDLVRVPRNWPSLLGRPYCTCVRPGRMTAYV